MKCIMLVGLSGSGKSTLAKKLLNEMPNSKIINADTLRSIDDWDNNMIFSFIHNIMIPYYADKKMNLIIDNTNLSTKYRRQIIKHPSLKNYEFEAYILNVPEAELLTRLEARNNSDYPIKIYSDVIYKQMSNFEIPFYEEGFNKIKIMNTPANIPAELYFKNIIDIDQENPHHILTLKNHMEAANNIFKNMNIKSYYYDALNLAIKMHDIGKPKTKIVGDDGIAHYLGHANVGAYRALTEFTSFKDDELLKFAFVINYHMHQFGTEAKATSKFGRDNLEMLKIMNICDSEAH